MLEKDVIRKTLAAAKRLGVPYIRMVFRAGVTSGWPDYLFLVPGGQILFIEFKATGGKPTPLQEQKIALLKENGFNVEVCDSPDAAINALRKAVEATRLSA